MTWLLMGMTFAVLPFGSIGFVFLIDLMLPKDEQIIHSLNLRKVKEFVGIRKKEVVENSEKTFLKNTRVQKKDTYPGNNKRPLPFILQ